MRLYLRLVLLLTVAVGANAGLLTFSDESSFQTMGQIVYNTNWDTFTGDFSFPGDPYTIGGVTYTSGENVIIGPESLYELPRPMLFYGSFTPLTADVDPTYTMLGFDLGVLSPDAAPALVDITVVTNFDTYQYTGLTIPYATGPLQFEGFVTDLPGEFITNFAISTESGEGWAAGVTDVQVGASPIPEPAAMLLVGFGVLGLGALGRRRRRT